MNTIVIAAMAQNRTIGRNNRIPWHIPEEMHHFKTTTTGHCVIMGRKTFESLGKALPRRTNVVITRQENLHFPGCITAQSIEQALACCKDQEKAFIIGGESIYREAMPFADTIILSVVKRNYNGDTFFPEIPQSLFELVSEKEGGQDQPFSLLIYQRRQGT